MAAACEPDADCMENPGAKLGAALGELHHAGRDKLTFVTGAEFQAFPPWLEQLIAESTGKDGKGLIPVAGETLGPPEIYGSDRVFAGLYLDAPGCDPLGGLDRIQAAGHPVLRIALPEPAGLGGEFFRWEFAVAASGAVLGINPFDQPDVQLAKDLARRAMEAKGSGGHVSDPGVSLDRQQDASDTLRHFLERCGPGHYISLQPYLFAEQRVRAALENLRHTLREKTHAGTTIGVGPRFLHSTGQLHKGGPDSGFFLQLVDQPAEDLTVPGKGFTFGALIRAQADGDFQALKSRNRRVMRINLGRNPAAALAELQTLL